MKSRAALILLTLVFGLNLYRAATQACTVDEAFTYNRFASKSVADILTAPYDANNHVLHTLLVQRVMHTFGVAELTLRLPSLLGGLLYLAMSWRICRYLLGDGWRALITFSALAINPFILDYLSLARGYGLAAGLFLTGFEQLARFLVERDEAPARLGRASLALGLAISANLTFIVPVLALAPPFFYLVVRERVHLSFWDAVNFLILPGTVACAVLMLLPLTRAEPGNFYFGAANVRDSFLSVWEAMLQHHSHPLSSLVNSWGGVFLIDFLLGVGLIGCAVPYAFLHRSTRRRAAVGFSLSCGALVISLLLISLQHLSFHVKLPHSRTALYFAVLFTLVVSFSITLIPGRVGNFAGLLFAAPFLIVFAAQLRPAPYHNWPYNAGDKRIGQQLRAELASLRKPVLISSNHLLEQSLIFYAKRYRWNRLAKIAGDKIRPGANYFVLLPEDRPAIETWKLQTLYVDTESGAILAKQAKRP